MFNSLSKKEPEYKIIFDDLESFYTNAKPSYKEGEEVEVYFNLIATDTDYSFILDGKKINPDYERGKGFAIRFVMPAHDVKLECLSSNTMFNFGD